MPPPMPQVCKDATAGNTADVPGAAVESEELRQLLALLGRAHRVAVLASADFADIAPKLQAALEARGCEVIAGFEGAARRPATQPEPASKEEEEEEEAANAQPDIVLLLGGAPANPDVWAQPGPLAVAARAAMGAAAIGVPVYALVAGGSTNLKGGPGPQELQGDTKTVEWLSSELARLPAELLTAVGRWDEAAQAAHSDATLQLTKCLSRWPELRAARDGNGRALLHVAAGAGAEAATAVLLEAGASVQATDKDGLAAGDAAFENGHQCTFDLLVTRGCGKNLAERRTGRASESTSGTQDVDPSGEPAAKRQRNSLHEAYLGQTLRYESGRLLDASGRGVMMGWEAPLMARHAQALLPRAIHGAVLNVGFGLGLVDGFLQERHPQSHTIIEAHRDVLLEMERRGWRERPGVVVRAGRWQDVVGSLPEGAFDAIFYDTWQETYDDLLAFMQRLPRLLAPGGRFSFFNGIAPYSIFEHATFCRLAQEDLRGLGFRCDFYPVELGKLGDDTWKGIMHRYWTFETYYLPLATRPSQESEPAAAADAPDVFEASLWRCWPSPAVRVGDRIGAGVPKSEFGL
mmetsp:Transcript_16347/g.46641  ORF Transcript_16347/g.46641 Transcript_16347/m.46641 type:complete len:577 (+) Transcript_16347:2-1732(+)